MNKFYEKIILAVLFFIVLYNLVNYDILEGKRRRRFKKKELFKKANIIKKNVVSKAKAKATSKAKATAKAPVYNNQKDNQKNNQKDNQKDNQNDKEISILHNKINNINANLINTQIMTSEKIPSLINHINSQSDIKLNKIQEQISNNNLKNQELKSFSERKGRELQGNIDLLSSDLANNNIKYSDQITEVKSKLDSLQKKVNIYEKNNSNIEEMLKNVNLQLDTKYVN